VGSRSVEVAVVRTMDRAGRTVVLSAVTVAIGLATLLLVPVPFMRSLGVAGLVVPIVSLAAALSLQPVLLSLLGTRGVTPVAFHGLIGQGARLPDAWSSVARLSLARPRSVLAVTIAVLMVGASGVFWLQLTPGSVVAIPQELESAAAIKLVSGRVGPGIISPVEVVVDAGGPGRLTTTGVASAMYRLAVTISRNKETLIVAMGDKTPFVDPTGRYERILVIGRHDLGNSATTQLVSTIRDRYIGASGFPRGIRVAVGGAPAQGMDFIGSVYGAFWWIALLAMVLAFLVLVRALRSLLLALVAVLLDVLSVAVTFGLLVIAFRSGAGSALLGTYQVGQIEAWVPVFLFAMLFGLSMDYEVFIVTRMRESRDAGASTQEAIRDGLVNTGAVVTAAAFILVGALSGLVFGRVAGLQELGVGLSLGVLIDATLVRGLVLPSVMALLGDWNWWLPGPLARALRTKPSPR
ncbi:MAG TPA: MMPL family transporter, partial [Acidimicrobiales bacterium]|nr:MMPL family transporter [Acidimicrobiales bacterium]